MSKPDPKICPRCGNSFDCRADDIRQCQCSSVALSDAARKYTQERYTDCLCTGCLSEIKSENYNTETGNKSQYQNPI